VVFQCACSLRLVVATAVLVAMRTHLFVWSVFAPKWMYEAMVFAFVMLSSTALHALLD